ncbi:MAG: hypothetical protein ABJF11_09360 [Reichenbachiella sp.]|uniref:hypothetical protein n=1 Tax=Reichenbachiella sp. TaxID=2184521 RepID=UPI0032649BA7
MKLKKINILGTLLFCSILQANAVIFTVNQDSSNCICWDDQVLLTWADFSEIPDSTIYTYYGDTADVVSVLSVVVDLDSSNKYFVKAVFDTKSWYESGKNRPLAPMLVPCLLKGQAIPKEVRINHYQVNDDESVFDHVSKKIRYNSDGKIIEEISYRKSGRVKTKKNFFYENGLLVKEVKTFAQTGAGKSTGYLYNEEQLLVEEIFTNSEGDVFLKIKYEYSESGVLKNKWEQLNSETLSTTKDEYHYNEKGKLIEVKRYSDGQIEIIETYAYDKQDRISSINKQFENYAEINEIEYEPLIHYHFIVENGRKTLSQRTVLNDDGKVVGWTSYDMNSGNIESIQKYAYDKNGFLIKMENYVGGKLVDLDVYERSFY